RGAELPWSLHDARAVVRAGRAGAAAWQARACGKGTHQGFRARAPQCVPQSLTVITGGWPGPLHGGRSSAERSSPEMLTSPPSRWSATWRGSGAVGSHQLLSRTVNDVVAAGSKLTGSPVAAGLWSKARAAAS